MTPAVGLLPLQDLQHGCEALGESGEHRLSPFGGPQGWPSYHPASGVLLHPGGQQVAPVVRDPVPPPRSRPALARGARAGGSTSRPRRHAYLHDLTKRGPPTLWHPPSPHRLGRVPFSSPGRFPPERHWTGCNYLRGRSGRPARRGPNLRWRRKRRSLLHKACWQRYLPACPAQVLCSWEHEIVTGGS